jgi:copper homeostasis protein
MKSREQFKIEICANSVESCIEAEKGGADRVELCAGIPEGGTTPSYGVIKAARESINIKLHVIIRPRGGDFLYSPLEIGIMENDIRIAKELGADGVVFGCLTPEGNIDMNANSRLMKAAKGMSTTFHRAFDCCNNPQKAMEQLIELHFDRILSSGLQPTAEKGMDMLKTLHEQANGRIIILAGCGVNETNIAKIQAHTGIDEFHFSARENMKSRMKYFNRSVYMGDKGAEEYSIDITTKERVANTIAALINDTKQ